MAEVNHEMRAHALLSASGASRWLNCSPSARLEEKYEASKNTASSVYAEEGTLAHEFGDLNLRKSLGQIDEKTYKAEIKKLKANKLYVSEMDAEVAKYTSYVLESLAEARKTVPDAVAVIEERIDYSHIVEGGFGTSDASIISNGTLEIIDLKYGKGVAVSAEKNPQLMLYGIGALKAFEMLYDIHTIKLTIVQPRLDNISSYVLTTKELVFWGEYTVKPAAAKAHKGEGVQKAGEHCKWCKVKAMCATLAAKNVALARNKFKDPHLLTDEQLLEVYNQIPMLVDWAKAVADHILFEAVNGKEWKGYKIVEGKSQRKWTDEEAVMSDLSVSYEAKDFTKTTLLGIPAIEKLVGKKDFTTLLGAYVARPSGKPTLVLETDKRPAMGVEQAKKDFGEPCESAED